MTLMIYICLHYLRRQWWIVVISPQALILSITDIWLRRHWRREINIFKMYWWTFRTSLIYTINENYEHADLEELFEDYSNYCPGWKSKQRHVALRNTARPLCRTCNQITCYFCFYFYSTIGREEMRGTSSQYKKTVQLSSLCKYYMNAYGSVINQFG